MAYWSVATGDQIAFAALDIGKRPEAVDLQLEDVIVGVEGAERRESRWGEGFGCPSDPPRPSDQPRVLASMRRLFVASPEAEFDLLQPWPDVAI